MTLDKSDPYPGLPRHRMFAPAANKKTRTANTANRPANKPVAVSIPETDADRAEKRRAYMRELMRRKRSSKD